jgi:hypothetical protein
MTHRDSQGLTGSHCALGDLVQPRDRESGWMGFRESPGGYARALRWNEWGEVALTLAKTL